MQHIFDVVNGVAIYADQREWSSLRHLYADDVTVDYSSLMGGGPISLKADDLIAGWESGLTRYTATHHLLGNHRLTMQGEGAVCIVYVQATHWLTSDGTPQMWTVKGWYDYRLRQNDGGWRIIQHKLTATMVYGDRSLLEMQGVAPHWLNR